MWLSLLQPQMTRLRTVEYLGQVADRPCRDARLLQPRQQFRAGELRRARFEQRQQFGTTAHAVGVHAEARIVCQRLESERGAEPQPDIVVRPGYVDVAVTGSHQV